jgi:hypothetical protein
MPTLRQTGKAYAAPRPVSSGQSLHLHGEFQSHFCEPWSWQKSGVANMKGGVEATDGSLQPTTYKARRRAGSSGLCLLQAIFYITYLSIFSTFKN